MRIHAALALIACAALSTHAAITFDSSFESGNGTAFTQVASNEYSFEIEPDTNSDDRQWFYFSVAGAEGETLTFDLLHTDTTNVSGHWDIALPVASSDGGETWDFIEGPTSHDNETHTYTFTHTMGGEPEQIAFHFPYTYSQLLSQLDHWDDSDDCTRFTIGESVQGRPIELLQITDASTLPDGGKMGMWIVARQHGAEVTGSFSAEGLIDFLLSDDPDAEILLDMIVFNIVPMMNPDGVVAGNYRDNFAGTNLNRVWDSATPDESPEVLAVTNAISEWVHTGHSYNFFCDMHSTSGRTDNYAYFPPPSVQPPRYRNPEEYAADVGEILSLLAEYNVDFTTATGESASTNPRLSRQHEMMEYGVLAILTEGIYNYPSYGPNSGEYMTPNRHRAIGAALGRALRTYFLFGLPSAVTVLSTD